MSITKVPIKKYHYNINSNDVNATTPSHPKGKKLEYMPHVRTASHFNPKYSSQESRDENEATLLEKLNQTMQR